MVDDWLIAAATLFAWMLLLWLVALRLRDMTFVDAGWAAGLAFIAIFFAVVVVGDPGRRWLVAGLATVWALRIAWHVIARWRRTGTEDRRYVNLRKYWGERSTFWSFWFFQVQTVLVLSFGVVYYVVMSFDEPLGRLTDALAVALWLVSVGGETLADRQLSRFRAQPENHGKVCRAGLWRYSRHPNYFFEWLHWWAYVVLAIGSPWWAVTLLGPVLMLLFLLFVTGIPATEAQSIRSRGDAYRDYQRTTSAFVPWFPRKETT